MKICFLNNLNKYKNNRLMYIVVFCFCIAILLIVFSFYLVNKAANNSKNIVDFVAEKSLENLNSYNLEYELIVYGNKTINKYNMKEEYKKLDSDKDYFKFNINNENISNLTYEFTDNSLKIYADNQQNFYEITNYQANKVNLFSLATFLNLYNEIKKSDHDCNNYSSYEEYEDSIILQIKLDKDCKDNIKLEEYNTLLNNASMNINKLELVLNKDNMLPIKYVGYDKDDKAYFEIIYNNIQIK